MPALFAGRWECT